MLEHQLESTGQDGREVPGDRYAEVCASIAACLAEMLSIPIDRVMPSSVLLDLGAQSFDFVDLVFHLERTYEIAMPRSYLIPDAYTVDQLARVVTHELSAK